jgi:hypothetical protein
MRTSPNKRGADGTFSECLGHPRVSKPKNFIGLMIQKDWGDDETRLVTSAVNSAAL